MKNLPHNKRICFIAAAAVLLIVLVVCISVNKSKEKPEPEQQKQTEIKKQYEAYIKTITPDSIMEEAGGITYVDSQILLTSSLEATKDDIEKLISGYGGEIVGYLELTGDYQIEFDEKKSYDELGELASVLEESPLIEMVDVHYLYDMDIAAYDDNSEGQIHLSSFDWTDPWTANEISNSDEHTELTGFGSPAFPSNYQWWAEAVNLPYAWQMTEGKLSPIGVGVIDTCFDSEHDDLSFEKLYQSGNSLVEAVRKDKIFWLSNNFEHGTHVAGIVAAAGNTIGMRGGSPNALLYGYGFNGNADALKKWDLEELEAYLQQDTYDTGDMRSAYYMLLLDAIENGKEPLEETVFTALLKRRYVLSGLNKQQVEQIVDALQQKSKVYRNLYLLCQYEYELSTSKKKTEYDKENNLLYISGNLKKENERTLFFAESDKAIFDVLEAYNKGRRNIQDYESAYAYLLTVYADEVYKPTMLKGNMEVKYAIATLLMDGARVINFSMNWDQITVSAQYDEQVLHLDKNSSFALRTLDRWGRSFETFILRIERGQPQFLIIKSAGNDSSREPSSRKKVMSNEIVPSNLWEKNIDEEIEGDDKAYDPASRLSLKNILKSNRERFELRDIPVEYAPEAVSVKYDVFGYIDKDSPARRHFIIVGAMDLEYTAKNPVTIKPEERLEERKYKRSSFSNIDADIYAPGGWLKATNETTGANTETIKHGIGILSTVPNYTELEEAEADFWITSLVSDQEKRKEVLSPVRIEEREVYLAKRMADSTRANRTGTKVGTSQATPIVSSIAALVWGYHPELKYEQVRECILSQDYATNRLEGFIEFNLPMVDAVAALKKADDLTSAEGHEKSGYLAGLVFVEDEIKPGQISIVRDSVIELYDVNGTKVYSYDQTGHDTFCMLVAPGTYSYRVYSKQENRECTGECEVTESRYTFLATQLDTFVVKGRVYTQVNGRNDANVSGYVQVYKKMGDDYRKYGDLVFTNQDGFYEFRGPQGDYRFRAYYGDMTDEKEMTIDASHLKAPDLLAGVTLSGHITDADSGKPLKAVIITVTHEDGTQSVVFSDEDGMWLCNVQNGEAVQCHFEGGGYESTDRSYSSFYTNEQSYFEADVELWQEGRSPYIRLGHYEQDNDLTDGPEPIEWIVVEASNTKALLISRYILDYIPFTDGESHYSYYNSWDNSREHFYSPREWDGCYMRYWLNHNFFENCFSYSERKKILKTRVTNGPDTDATIWTTVEDNVFLMSNDFGELTEGWMGSPSFNSGWDFAAATATPYALSRSDRADDGVWYLRDNGGEVVVGSNGQVIEYSYRMPAIPEGIAGGVRPAICVDLSVISK